ncbi:hypothetical protein tb265_15870 [Gemmatimonadetes bacterium T265]|nr:hypothetical protein tb265_15870 [Gemmatimonadetes bacterium T265]
MARRPRGGGRGPRGGARFSRARFALVAAGVAATGAAGVATVIAGRTPGDERVDPLALAAVAALTIDVRATRLAPGDTARVVATARNVVDQPLPGRLVTWTTSDSGVVTVTPRGDVRAVAPGTAVLEAACQGQSTDVAITVVGRVDTVGVRPGDELQVLVAAAEEGTVFVIRAGVHHGDSVVPKNGMTFVGEPGAVLTGDDRAPFAFSGNADPYPRNVVIRDLVIEHYASPAQAGAVRADVEAGAWTVEDCEVRDNAGGGILIGPRARILRNRVHHNGQIGVSGSGDGVLVEGNEIAYNNPRAEYDMYWEAGGTKFARTRDLVVRGNFVHHNHGPGLWTDIDNVRTLYERNRVEDNAESGIFHEIGYAAVIRHNESRRNGAGAVPRGWVSGAGILVNSSSDVEIYGNLVEGNHNGITAIEANRGRGAYGPYVLRDLYVHDNTVAMREGATGVATSGWRRLVDRATYAAHHNRFTANTYRLGPNRQYFRWSNTWLTAAEWRAAGQDVTGTFAPDAR